MNEAVIQKLLISQRSLLEGLPDFRRERHNVINWEFPLIAIIGQRGVGKTTMMLQELKTRKQGVYIACDNIFVIEYGLLKLAHNLYHEYDQREFFIDEIHTYPDWAREIKNIHDSFRDIHIVVSGSSALDMAKASADLSRRVSIYHLDTLTFREYLELHHDIELPPIMLDEMFHDYRKYVYKHGPKIKERHFREYLREYAYMYRSLTGNTEEYFALLGNAIRKTIYEDVSRLYSIESRNLQIFEKILFFLGNSTPSEMSFLRIANKVGIDPKTCEWYIKILESSGLLAVILKEAHITGTLVKDKKILLTNPNLVAYYQNMYNPSVQNTGLVREVFFAESIRRTTAQIKLHTRQDFTVQYKGKRYICEVGGSGKRIRQSGKNCFVFSDTIASSGENTIPLWLPGML